MLVALLCDSWCELLEVAQVLQMPIVRKCWMMLRTPARPATLKVPGTPSRIVMEQHSLTHFPSLLEHDVRRISRT